MVQKRIEAEHQILHAFYGPCIV